MQERSKHLLAQEPAPILVWVLPGRELFDAESHVHGSSPGLSEPGSGSFLPADCDDAWSQTCVFVFRSERPAEQTVAGNAAERSGDRMGVEEGKPPAEQTLAGKSAERSGDLIDVEEGTRPAKATLAGNSEGRSGDLIDGEEEARRLSVEGRNGSACFTSL